MIRFLTSPWVDTFECLLGEVSESLVICSPFVGRAPCAKVATVLCATGRRQVHVFLLTDLSRDNMLSGATDVGALVHLCEALPNTEIRFLPNLHAKAYVADERCAVVSSANLTEQGLLRNLEYGLYLSEPRVVRQVRRDIIQYGSLGSVIDTARLQAFEGIVAGLRGIRATAEETLKKRLRREFERKLQAADREILRARAEGLSAHAAFADTILYLLAKGPRSTKALYSEIQRIHPDLCDDSIKLVVRGEEWNQVKWHHRVRHAELFLKRQGRIETERGKWRLARSQL
jgi:phosphatidylserine/phosphatidylglycerophosphate/cardiolipin synthase-like enzyme